MVTFCIVVSPEPTFSIGALKCVEGSCEIQNRTARATAFFFLLTAAENARICDTECDFATQLKISL